MLENLMPFVPLLLDVGNIAFFIGNIPQLITAFKNRKNLIGLSSKMLATFMVSTLFFILVGLITIAPMTTILGIVNEVMFAVQLYWKRKYKPMEKLTLDEAGWSSIRR